MPDSVGTNNQGTTQGSYSDMLMGEAVVDPNNIPPDGVAVTVTGKPGTSPVVVNLSAQDLINSSDVTASHQAVVTINGASYSEVVSVAPALNGAAAVTVSLVPKNPVPPSPLGDFDGINTRSWFGSFVVVFSTLINQIAVTDEHNKALEKQVELNQRATSLATAEDTASQKIAQGQVQAQEQIMQAIGDFANALNGAAQVGSVSLANRQADKSTDIYKTQTANAQKELQTEQTSLQTLKDRQQGKGVAVGDDPSKVKPVTDDDIEAQQKKVDAAQQKVHTAQQTQKDAEFRAFQTFNDINKQVGAALTSAIKGITDVATGQLKVQESVIGANITMLEQFQQQIQTNTQNSSQFYSSLTQTIGDVISALKQYQDQIAQRSGGHG